MRALRLTLICSGIAQGTRKAKLPLYEPVERRSCILARALRSQLARAYRTRIAPGLPARQTADMFGLSATPVQVNNDGN